MRGQPGPEEIVVGPATPRFDAANASRNLRSAIRSPMSA